GSLIKDFEKKIIELFDYIKTSTSDVALLLENLMEWAYTRSGKITYSPTEVILLDIVEKVHRLYQSTAYKKGNDFTYSLNGKESAIIDRDMVYTILRNLVGNAIKFTREGKVHINISCTNKLFIKVTDTGVGMSPKIIDKIFNLVDKEIRNGTDEEKGTGLGMVVVKEFVDFHQGNISIMSELCKGTSITIEIPLSHSHELKDASVNIG
ncbi:MAG: HAMP domain-containing histidine kinase, partial [Bacteroidales bacterium]|nr:HAMP domain-containing histidine kinase [Bacteroidales bacterium]